MFVKNNLCKRDSDKYSHEAKKGVWEIRLPIAAQLVDRQADYLVQSGYANIQNLPRNGRLHTAQIPGNVRPSNNLILTDKRATVKELSL